MTRATDMDATDMDVGPADDSLASLVREIRTLSRLATPLAILQLANSTIQAVDTAMAGRLSEVDIAAVGLGNILYFATIVIGMGIILGFDPLIAQALGAEEHERAAHLYRQSVLASLLLSIPLALIVLATLFALPALGIDRATASATLRYTAPKLFAIFFFLAGTAARSYLQAIGTPRPLVVAALAGNVVNVLVGFPLVFGDRALAYVHVPPLGFHGLGVMGAGIAAATSMGAIAAMLFALAPRTGLETSRFTLDRAVQKQALVVGLPVGLHYFAEVAAFAVAAVALARISATDVAAHQIALTLCSITFQVAVAIGAAASVEVGRAVGAGSPGAPRRAGLAAFILGAGVALLAGLAFATIPDVLVSWLSSADHVKAVSVQLVRIASLFLLLDAWQTIGAGALRGAGDTTTTLRANVFGHYFVGVPLGLGLAFGRGLGVIGLWWGLSFGLSVVAIWLFVRFFRTTRGHVARL